MSVHVNIKGDICVTSLSMTNTLFISLPPPISIERMYGAAGHEPGHAPPQNTCVIHAAAAYRIENTCVIHRYATYTVYTCVVHIFGTYSV